MSKCVLFLQENYLNAEAIFPMNTNLVWEGYEGLRNVECNVFNYITLKAYQKYVAARKRSPFERRANFTVLRNAFYLTMKPPSNPTILRTSFTILELVDNMALYNTMWQSLLFKDGKPDFKFIMEYKYPHFVNMPSVVFTLIHNSEDELEVIKGWKEAVHNVDADVLYVEMRARDREY